MTDFVNHNFNITQIALACFVPAGSGTPVHKNRSHHGLAYHTGGERCYVFDDGHEVLAKANDLVYLPKGSNYVVTGIVPGDCYAINFDISESVAFAPFGYRVKTTHLCLESFKEAEAYWKNKYAGYEMKCKAAVYTVICLMLKEMEIGYISESRAAVLRPALLHIHNEYTKENIPISLLAALCGISEIYFRKLFKQFLGMPPLQYINGMKMERAKELLASRLYTVSQVAALSGFHDESYFSREFKKYFNVPPSEYEKEPAVK